MNNIPALAEPVGDGGQITIIDIGPGVALHAGRALNRTGSRTAQGAREK